MKKCSICNKEYVENPMLEVLPLSLKEKLKYISNCECEFEILQKENEEKMKLQILENEKQSRLNKVKKYKDISVQDKKFFESTFENTEKNNYTKYCEKYANAFIVKENAPGIIFYGKVGTGKTHLAACISNRIMDNGKTVLTLNMSRYLGRLRKEWSEAEEDILNHVESVDLLVIDDFGVENMTSWTYEKIFNLIDKRYRTGKACIITTNLNYSKDTTENELAIKFKDEFGNNRISDRINEMCYPMLIEGESRRKPDRNRFMEFLS